MAEPDVRDLDVRASRPSQSYMTSMAESDVRDLDGRVRRP